MGCLTGMVRTIMFIFNFACLAVGVVLMAVGGFFYVSVDEYQKLIENTSGLNVVPALTIGVGVIVFLIAFLGCCGAMKNNSCMLITYAIILIVMLIVQFAGGIYGIVHMKNNGNTIKEEVTQGMEKALGEYKKTKVIRDLFQSMQSELKCCGARSPADYISIVHWEPLMFPGGCCAEPTKDLCSKPQEAYQVGCGPLLFDEIENAVKVVAIVALVICAVELLGAIFAICLVKSK